MLQIRNKLHFYKLASKGLCGNTPICWLSVEDYAKQAHKYPMVGIRSSAGFNKICITRIHYNQVGYMHRNNLLPKDIIISQIPPFEVDNEHGLQGELSWFDGQWCLYYTHKLGYMREKLRLYGRHCFGFAAINLIRQYASPSGYTMLFDVFDKYTEQYNYPAIEFACFPFNFGYYNQDVCIWEVRNNY